MQTCGDPALKGGLKHERLPASENVDGSDKSMAYGDLLATAVGAVPRSHILRLYR